MTKEAIADAIRALIINESDLENGDDPWFTGIKEVTVEGNTVEMICDSGKRFVITVQ